MAYGFRSSYNFDPILGWELYQVTLDKYHVMFHFNDGWGLLNVAHSFLLRSPDGKLSYRYEIYGPHKYLNLDPILRESITTWHVRSLDDLELEFSNGFILTVHDQPNIRSWWFMGGHTAEEHETSPKAIAALSDIDEDLLTDEEIRERNA